MFKTRLIFIMLTIAATVVAQPNSCGPAPIVPYAVSTVTLGITNAVPGSNFTSPNSAAYTCNSGFAIQGRPAIVYIDGCTALGPYAVLR